MAEKIILAEDTVAFRDALVEILQAQGFETVAVGDGVAAEAAVNEGGAALLILDLLLPKKQGLQVAEVLRAAGNNIPIIMMSGVLKTPAQAKDAKERLKVKEFLHKPLEGEVFIAAVMSALGRPMTAQQVVQQASTPAEPLPAKGSCAEFPPGLLAFRAQAERHSGILDMGNSKERARLFFYKGALVMAQSNAEGKNLGAELVRMGILSPGSLAEAVRGVSEENAGLYKVLLGRSMVDEATAKEAYKNLAPSILRDCVGMSGRFRWTATDGFARLIPAVNVPVLTHLFEGIKATRPDVAEKLLEGRKQHRVSRGPGFDRFGPAVEGNFGPDAGRAINGRSRLGQIIEAAPSPENRAQRVLQMFALICTQGAVTDAGAAPAGAAQTSPVMPAVQAPPSTPAHTPVPGSVASVANVSRAAVMAESQVAAQRAPTGPVMAAAQVAAPQFTGARAPTSSGVTTIPAPAAPRAAPLPAAAGPAALPAGVDPEMAAVLRDAEARVGAMLTQTHYEVLGIPPEADAGTIKKAYFALAGRFHPDKFSGVNLGDFKGRVDAVFARVNEANDVLSKPERRQDYDLQLKAKAAGLQTDIGAIFEAESNFAKAEAVMMRGDMAAAKKLLERAVELDKKELYEAYLLFAAYNVAGRPKAKAQEVIAQLEAYAAKAAIPRVQEFMGHVARAGELWGDMRKYWTRVMDDPQGNKALAQREIQFAMQKIKEAKEGDKGGLMGKLFKS